MKKIINALLERLNLRLVNTSRIGVNYYTDIKRTNCPIYTALDIGANIGEVSKNLLQYFPNSSVHAFEPIQENFSHLDKIDSPRLTKNNLAVGNYDGEVKIYLNSHSGLHSPLVVEDQDKFQIVKQCKLDTYCQNQGLERLGIVKIDTEGGDLLVLEGLQKYLENKTVDFLILETTFYDSHRHISIDQYIEFLKPYEYYVYGVYDQSSEWNKKARIQYANVLFARYGIEVT